SSRRRAPGADRTSAAPPRTWRGSAPVDRTLRVAPALREGTAARTTRSGRRRRRRGRPSPRTTKRTLPAPRGPGAHGVRRAGRGSARPHHLAFFIEIIHFYLHPEKKTTGPLLKPIAEPKHCVYCLQCV